MTETFRDYQGALHCNGDHHWTEFFRIEWIVSLNIMRSIQNRYNGSHPKKIKPRKREISTFKTTLVSLHKEPRLYG